ncbi:MAG: AsnC family transcriptional regulator [Pseudomonadota bacterium]|jgi:Lrp/AsnC family leucine-responsive transcriptional regulator
MDADLTLDAVDRRIIDALQQHGRITFDELAAQVQLSASAVLRRVRRLEEAGVIAGYAALVPPARIGLHLSAYIEVRLQHGAEARTARVTEQFRAAVQTWPEVVHGVCLGNDMSYLLHVVVTDMDHYGRFMSDTLLPHPGVQDCETRFVLDQIKDTRPALF